MPETKLRLIRSLKAQGEVVAMTGDGVNDAPALKAAHIGVSMGRHGTEVARQASSLVLLDDDLSAMVDAVAMGRKIYANLKKAIQYIIAIHLPILSVVLLPIVFGWPYLSIFTPIHVIFLELVMGPTCSIVFENEPMEPALMSRRPRKFSVAFFTWRELSMSLLQGLVISLGLMIVTYAYLLRQADEETVRSIVFTTLVLSNILLTLTGRSRDRSVLTTIRYRNKLLPLIIAITVVLLVAILAWPPAMSLFGMHTPEFVEIILCLGVALLSVIWVEFTKKR
jgi:Ca2+-transporting ATPase